MTDAPAPSKSEHFYGMQILRGLAALIVVFDHSGEVATGLIRNARSLFWLKNGAFGVDLFFPISGFVIFISATSLLRRYQGKSGVWKDFAVKRLIRIVPVYWISTTIKLLTLVLIPSAVTHYRFQIWNAISSYLFIFSYNATSAPRPVLPIGWTLNYEMFFYLIITLALAFRVSILRWTTAVILLLAIAHPFISRKYAISYFADPIELEFLGGMFLATAVPTLRKIPVAVFAVLSAISLWFALVYIRGTLELQPTRPIYWGIPGLIILATFVGIENRFNFQRFRGMLLLGDASYSIYLTHTIVLAFFAAIARKAHLSGEHLGPVFVIAGASVGIATGILFHLYCELPLTRALMGRNTSWTLRSATPAT